MQRSRLAVLIVSTLFAWSLCVASSQAGGWTHGPAFADDGSIFSSDIAIGSDGVSNVVWSEGMDPIEVYLRRRTEDGTLGPKLKLGSGGFPTVEATDTGSVVAWIEINSSGNEFKPMVSWVSADGTVSTRAVAPNGGAVGAPPLLAVEPDGDAMVAWGDGESDDIAQLHVRRMSPTGPAGQTVDLGLTGLGGYSELGTMELVSGGHAFVSWQKPDAPGVDGNAATVARFSPAGQLESTAIVSGSAVGLNPQIISDPGGSLVMWTKPDSEDSGQLFASRLSSTGPIAGSSQPITDGIMPSIPQTAAMVGADGTATIAYGRQLTPTTAEIYVRRFAQDGMLGPEVPLSRPVSSTPYAAIPMMASGRDGSMIVTWLRTTLSSGSSGETEMSSRSISADGTVSPQIAEVPDFEFLGLPPALAGNGSGEVALTWIRMVPPAGPDDVPAARLETAFLDDRPPKVTPTIPAKLVRGVDGKMTVNATDASGIAGIEWQFGDGSGAKGAEVAHAYARAGKYEVTVTVTDNLDNEAVVSRTIAVREPPVPAGLKLTKVLRKKNKVSITGQLSRLASGKVTLTWKQKAGKKTVAVKRMARIAKGGFKATIKLKGKLARSRAPGKLKAVYGGNEATRPASVSRTVKASK